MDWNGLWGLIYGFFSGLFSFLPASPQVHQTVLVRLAGLPAPGYGIAFAVHLGALAAVIASYYERITKLSRERKMAALPLNRRKRQPNAVSLMEWKLLKLAAIPMIVSSVAALWLGPRFNRMWLLVLIVGVNGVIVLLPNYMSRANKDARTTSPLDALLVGIAGMFCAIPGFSGVGLLTSVASMRGQDRQFALDFTYLLMIPVLAVLSVGDVAMLMIAGGSGGFSMFFTGVLACVASCGAGLLGIRMMRFLAVKTGYESFAYYNWGLAMFAFVIYLIG